MNPWVKSFLIALVIETLCFGLMHSSPWGPYGPDTALTGTMFMIHLPAMFFMDPLSGLHLPEWTFFPVLFAIATCLWMLLVRVILAIRVR
ncbi:MAG: hypothetical protein V4662_17520 [Verrucomicrobiota bacterium]